MKSLKLGAKMAMGFGLLILITLLLGGLAVWNMEQVAVESTKLATEYVPEVDVAGQMQGAANRVMYAMRGYGLTENEKYYKDAQKELGFMEKVLAQGEALAQKAVYLTKLTGGLAKIKQAEADYKSAVNTTKDSIGKLGGLRKELDINAAAYMKASTEFMTSQSHAFDKDLAQRQKNIDLVTQLVNLGTTVRVMNFKAQATNDPELFATAMEKLGTVRKITGDMRSVLSHKDDVALIGNTEGAAEGYMQAMASFFRQFRKGEQADVSVLEKARLEMDKNASAYVKNCDAFLKGQQKKLTMDMQERKAKINMASQIMGLGNDTRIKAFKAQALREPALLQDAQKNFPKIAETIAELRNITRMASDLALIKQVEDAAQGYSTAMGAMLVEWKRLQSLGAQRDGLGKSMINACVLLADAGMTNTISIANAAMHELNTSSVVLLIGLAVALAAGILLAFFITRSTTKPVARVIDSLTQSSEQVSSASSEVAGASQQLASGASQQAASLEETSSSLEEMASMTRQNADNATQADSMMKEAASVVAKANQSMEELRGAMEKMNQASDETAKIIKTIDEIAFQTNLLALNAAVEAARAGDAGAGFAVVADEVRNLAMRAAEAAKNTSDLIAQNINDIKHGSTLVVSTDESFKQVQKSSNRVGDLVGEIAAASMEQSQGIDQINNAMADMDKITQQNASSAEESAAASEELNAQSSSMLELVGDLASIVGNARHDSQKETPAVGGGQLKERIPHQAGTDDTTVRNDPQKAIPLDQDGFRDF